MFFKKTMGTQVVFIPFSKITAVIYSPEFDEYFIVVPGLGKTHINKDDAENYHKWYKMEAYRNVRINMTKNRRPGGLIQMNDIEKVRSWKKYSNTEFQAKLKDFDDWLDVAEKDRMLVSKYKYGVDDRYDNVHIKEMDQFFDPPFKCAPIEKSQPTIHEIWKILYDADESIFRTEDVIKKGLGVRELDKEIVKIYNGLISDYVTTIEKIHDYVINIDQETITPEKLNEITIDEKDRNIVTALSIYLFSEDGKFPNKFIWKMIEPKELQND